MQDAATERHDVVADTVQQRRDERLKYEIGVVARGDWTGIAGLRRAEGPLSIER
jgi:hypothetical protein